MILETEYCVIDPFLSLITVSYTIYIEWIVKAMLPLLTFFTTTVSFYVQPIFVQFSVC